MSRSQVALLTGGGDRPYALGLAGSLIDAGIRFDFIGSDFLESEELRRSPQVRFMNLRGDARPEAPLLRKTLRVVRYYARLIRYAAGAEPPIFHILWNNKLEWFDRTLLLLYYRLLGKRLVYTVHNVNAAQRDGQDSAPNRLTLRIQYHLVQHLFVHTEAMQRQLQDEFGVPQRRISVIPFGINSTVPVTSLTGAQARARIGLEPSAQCILFFGNIAPYKGLSALVEAFALVATNLPRCCLVIAGRPKGSESYWAAIRERIETLGLSDRVIERIEYVPDEETEIYFKAADVLALPYTHVFQSGVLFLGYNFGLPAIASDIASFRADVVEGATGFVCAPRDESALAHAIERYFGSELYRDLAQRRDGIRQYAIQKYSWSTVAAITQAVYRNAS